MEDFAGSTFSFLSTIVWNTPHLPKQGFYNKNSEDSKYAK